MGIYSFDIQRCFYSCEESKGKDMTIEELKCSNKNILTPGDIAPILECDANTIRYQARQDIKQLGFPASKIGTRIKIPRQAFIDWYEGNKK